MKTIFLILIGILIIGTATSLWSQETVDTCTVTYIANEGFLIKTHDHKVLIDALFGNIEGNWCDQPNDSVSALMVTGAMPFDNIDMVFVTHNHADHFNGPMTVNFLKNNRKSVLICPDQVDELLKRSNDYTQISDRINSIKPGNPCDTSFSINAVNVRALRFDHGSYYLKDSVSGEPINIHRDVENLGYVIDIDGFTIFHSGDDSPLNKAQYKAYNLGNKKIDIAFLDRVFLTPKGNDLVREYIHADYLILMHIETKSDNFFKSIKSLPGDIPQIFVFSKPSAKKIFLKKR